jgi:hypothetical protein
MGCTINRTKSVNDLFNYSFKTSDFNLRIKNVGHGVCNIKKFLNGGKIIESPGMLYFKKIDDGGNESIKIYSTNGTLVSEFRIVPTLNINKTHYRYIEYRDDGCCISYQLDVI